MRKYNETIKELRKERGFTQVDVALGLGIQEREYQRLESGETANPRLSTLKKLAHFFGVTLDYLAGESDKQTNEATLIMKQLNLTDRKEVLNFAKEKLK